MFSALILMGGKPGTDCSKALSNVERCYKAN